MTQATPNRNRDTQEDRVALDNEAEMLYWTYHFDVSPAELAEAIDVVGDNVNAVAAYLNTGR